MLWLLFTAPDPAHRVALHEQHVKTSRVALSTPGGTRSAQATNSNAKVSAETWESANTIRKRMLSLLAYNFEDEEGTKDTLDYIRSGAHLALLDPFGLGERLALRAMAVQAGIIGGSLVVAPSAFVEMSPKSGRSTSSDVAKDAFLFQRQ